MQLRNFIVLFVSIAIFSQSPAQRAGALDNTFGVNGRVITPIDTPGGISGIGSLALQTDGSIIAFGNVYSDPNSFNLFNYFALARYNVNGVLDTSFGTKGMVVTSVSKNFNVFDFLSMGIIQPDGKIIAGGTSSNGLTYSSACSLVRYNQDGSLDSSFGDGGAVIGYPTESPYEGMSCLALQADGKILGGGQSSNTGMQIVRYNSNGGIDSTFGINGAVTGERLYADSNIRLSGVNSLVVQPDGKIVAACTGNFINGSNYISALIRLSSNGLLDGSFGNYYYPGIEVVGDSTIGFPYISALTIDSTGKLVVCGSMPETDSTTQQTTSKACLARFTANGIPDATFGSSAIAVISFVGDTTIPSGYNQNNGEVAYSLAIQADGKIDAAVTTHQNGPNQFAVISANADGSPDTSFGNNGVVITAFDSLYNNAASGIVIKADGKIVVGGSAEKLPPHRSGLRGVIMGGGGGDVPPTDFALACYIPQVNTGTFDLPARDMTVLLYPNPAESYLHIVAPVPVTTYSIYNTLGALIVRDNSAGNIFNIDAHSLAPGLYLLNLQTNEGAVVKKFVKE